jgi:nucleoid DNA-binding protein
VNTSNISLVISELLQFNECVTIPEFGAFVVNPASAQIDMSKNKFIPPGNKVSFNKNIRNNDGLLASAFAENQGLSYEDALEYLKAFVFQVQSELKKQNVFELSGIGSFYKTTENLLKFEPDQLDRFSSFGLETFHLTPLHSQPYFGKENIRFTTDSTPEIKYIRKTGTWGKVGWGIAIIPFLAYLVWVPTKSGILNKNKNFQFSNLNPFKSVPCEEYTPRPIGISNIDLDISDLLYDELDISNLKFAVPETTNIVTVIPIEKSIINRYQIIGGCFSEESNANKLVERLTNQGYHAEIFDFKNGLYRVSYGGFPSQREARIVLREVKANANASAWLYRMK